MGFGDFTLILATVLSFILLITFLLGITAPMRGESGREDLTEASRVSARKPKKRESVADRAIAADIKRVKNERIKEFVEETGKSRKEAEEFLELWMIDGLEVSHGDEEPEIVYVPYQMWEDAGDAWLFGKNYKSYEEAVQHVESAGGKLFASRGHGPSPADDSESPESAS